MNSDEGTAAQKLGVDSSFAEITLQVAQIIHASRTLRIIGSI